MSERVAVPEDEPGRADYKARHYQEIITAEAKTNRLRKSLSARGSVLAWLAGLVAVVTVRSAGISPAGRELAPAEDVLFRLAPIERNDERFLPLFHDESPLYKLP